jgi:Spy/CpxP family protein refolding chaperone
MNIQVPEQKRWLQQHMEPEANNWPLERGTRVDPASTQWSAG